MASRPVLTKTTREICECWPDDMNTQRALGGERYEKRRFQQRWSSTGFYLKNLLLVFKLYMALFPLLSVICRFPPWAWSLIQVFWPTGPIVACCRLGRSAVKLRAQRAFQGKDSVLRSDLIHHLAFIFPHIWILLMVSSTFPRPCLIFPHQSWPTCKLYD